MLVQSKYLLFTIGGQNFRNITRYLRQAWRQMGLKGDINFTLICTAISNCAKKTLPPDQGKWVSFMMCHDTKTADKYYTKNPGMSETLEVRELVKNMMVSPSHESSGGETLPSTSGTAPSAEERSSRAPRGDRRGKNKRSSSPDSNSSSDPDKNTPVVYQESGTSSAETEIDPETDAETDTQQQRKAETKNKKLLVPCSVKISPYKMALRKLEKQTESSKIVHHLLEKIPAGMI
ncbi:uncharacterized protein LOC106527514 [Austrofundulus limnaeus]|uniref:Uncharacterized protein LOC106527514 n=1 Tax=Austrofundulus limnaeus TaxID=52670 RepID=A0A2I4CD25_AUSLI|nr:PREDICTED: uncharacterized protein LOC106527514 [Austrofundulus limnaeus]